MNYNGAEHLSSCLRSLAAVERGLHSFGVTVVDNGSNDSSAALVAEYPEVNLIRNGLNLGFSRGNNRGVAQRLKELRSSGVPVDFLCFLNNDTSVEPHWLTAALERFASDESIGIVGSKSLFFDRFIPLEFTLSEHGERIFLGELEDVKNIRREPTRSKWIDWGPEDPRLGRAIEPGAQLLLAVANPHEPATFEMVFHRPPGTKGAQTVEVMCGAKRFALTLSQDEPGALYVCCDPADYRSAIQTAGACVLPSWDAYDIGMYALDGDHFDTPREVAAICGVSLFIRRELFETLGGFDEEYFAYYEDTDLSLRARLRGYTCWYEPASVLRHLHCASSGEKSAYFAFNVARSHLLFASRWMPPQPFRQKIRSILRAAAQELKLYADDHDLTTKPNLRTLCQAVKHPGYLVAQRFFERRQRRAIATLPSTAKHLPPPNLPQCTDAHRTQETDRAK